MFDWREVVVQRERRQDFLLEAERHRLVRQVLARHAKRDHIYCRALTWLGRQLVAWGCSLQEHYGAPIEAPAVPVANHCR